MTSKKFTCKDRSTDTIATVPVEHLRSILDIADPSARGMAFSGYFDKVREANPTINDIEHLKSLINWSPEGKGLQITEMAPRIDLASRIIAAEALDKEKPSLALTENDALLLKSILSSEGFMLKPSMAVYGFLVDLQDYLGMSLVQEKEGTKSNG